MEIKSIFSGKRQKNRPERKHGKVENDPIICVTCPHYAVISQSWGVNNQGDQGPFPPTIQAPLTSSPNY